MDGRLKSIIEGVFREVNKKTGLRLSYGKVARAFWSTLANNPKARERCMGLVCKALLEEAKKNKKKTQK